MKSSIIKRIFDYIKPYKKYLVFTLLTAILGVSLTLYIPVLIGKAVDKIAG